MSRTSRAVATPLLAGGIAAGTPVTASYSSNREEPGSTASEATCLHGSELVYCRQCATWVAVSATRELSTHPTAGGLVTYFRCSAGHADFYTVRRLHSDDHRPSDR